MVTCAEFLTEFGNYLEGEMAPELRRELEYHLAHCSSCRVIADSTGKTIKIVSASGEMDLSEALSEPLVSKIMERVQRGRSEDAAE